MFYNDMVSCIFLVLILLISVKHLVIWTRAYYEEDLYLEADENDVARLIFKDIIRLVALIVFVLCVKHHNNLLLLFSYSMITIITVASWGKGEKNINLIGIQGLLRVFGLNKEKESD